MFFADVFEKALSAGFIQATDYVEIWQAYLDYLRRRVDFSKGWRSLCSYSVTVLIMCWPHLRGSFHFIESSKELEELRGAFTRSLDYMKQDVEERTWI